MTEIRQYDVVEAVFSPREISDLRHGASEFIGEKIVFDAGPLIEDGPYSGMLQMWGRNPFVGWVPDCDLNDPRTLDRLED